jgi:hypothetical protein
MKTRISSVALIQDGILLFFTFEKYRRVEEQEGCFWKRIVLLQKKLILESQIKKPKSNSWDFFI